MSDFGVTAEWEDDLCILVMKGEARLETAYAFDSIAQDIADRGTTRVAIDMSGLGFMDSASAGVLLKLRAQLAERDGRLVLFGLRRLVARLLERTGLGDQFPSVDTREEARAFLA